MMKMHVTASSCCRSFVPSLRAEDKEWGEEGEGVGGVKEEVVLESKIE